MPYTPLIVTFAAATLLVLYRKQIQEGLSRFGRGPRPPSSPLPADDAFVLLRKRNRFVRDEQQ